MMTFITVKIRVGEARERVSIAGVLTQDYSILDMLRDILKQE